MADDNQNQSAEDEQPEIAPSTLFLEMMRRAARESEAREPIPEEPVIEEIEETPAEDELLSFDEVFSDDEDIEVDDETPQSEIEDNVSASDEETADEPIVEVPPNFDSRIPIYEAPTLSEEERQTRLEEQRIQRIRRRRERQFRRRVGIAGGFFRTIFVSIFAAALASTIFMWFMDADWITPDVGSILQESDATSAVVLVNETPTVPPVTPNYLRRIGIVAGHHGPENDPGAVCPDGLTETDINFAVAQLVVRNLRDRGFAVDLLDEFDPRLDGYQVAALVSIHSNDCTEYAGGASGYLVARAASRPSGSPDDILAECISKYYQPQTQLDRRFELTLDMTDYHTFREIHPLTPAAIIELGFMRDDRELLTERQGAVAQGITEGIFCFLSGENPIVEMTATPITAETPTETPTGG